MWTIQNAKSKFAAVVEAALAGRPEVVARHGKPAVVVVSAKEYDRLIDAARARRGRFADHLLAFPSHSVERIKAKPRAAAF